jgi:hypothetical protein
VTAQVRRQSTNASSAGLQEALELLLREVESLNERVQEYDRRIARMANETCPETALRKTGEGVGNLIAMAHVRTIEDPR